MSGRPLTILSLALGIILLLAQPIVGSRSAVPTRIALAGASVPSAQHAAIATDYGHLPLAFELNAGQDADPAIRFLTHGAGYTLALTPSAALLALDQPSAVTASAHQPFALPARPSAAAQPSAPPSLLGMRWLGANPNPVVMGEQPLPGTVNYFIGHNPAKWHTNIPTYQQVRLHNVYPGVDLVYYGTSGQLEYDFVVAPGASPAAIQLGFSGTSQVGVDLLGNLSLALPGGAIAQEKPLVYQQTASGARTSVAGGYALSSGQRVGFALGAYNPHLPLVIDPAYRFSTYLGGSNTESPRSIALDSSGNAYVMGFTDSTDFRTFNPFQATNAGGGADVYVTKFNAAGTALIFSTYLGGSGFDYGLSMALDASGNAYLTGGTSSTDFPLASAFQSTLHSPSGNAFVTKLNAAGSALVYSTYLGGSGTGNGDAGIGIAVDASGNAYVAGSTTSSDFPTHTPLQSAFAGVEDAFVTKFNAAGSGLVYSTYLGGSQDDRAEAIAVDGVGNAYVAGSTFSTDFPTHTPFQASNTSGAEDAFVSKLNTVGSALTYSTYLGGTSGVDYALGIALDSSGDAYVTGTTGSTNFPITPAAFEPSNAGGEKGFVTKFDAAGTDLVYSTFLGGSNADLAYGIAVDSSGDAYVSGTTQSTNFPLVNPLQNTLHSSGGNAFVTRFNATGSALIFSTYLGGSSVSGDFGYCIAVGAGGNVYVDGQTSSTDFPTLNPLFPVNAGNGDAFVTKIETLPSVDTTTGVFRPSNGTLYLKNANTTGPADITLAYGLPGDQPITGDWTGKGYKSIGIYRNGTFYLRNSNTTGFADIVVPFGASTDIPVAGDWTGKGYDSVGVYRPSNSTFYLRDSNTTGAPDHTVTLGITGDVPIVGDWTAKGWDSVGVFRPSNGIVYLRNSNTTGFADIAFTYGIAGDKPVVGDWTAQGKDTIGVDRNGNFLLRTSNSTGPANLSFYLGVSGDDPIAGPWLAPASAPPHHPGATVTRQPVALPKRHMPSGHLDA